MNDASALCSEIERFEWNLKTHLLKPARHIADGFVCNDGPFKDAGFALLCIVLPCIESLGQHLLGGDKSKAFEKGLDYVFKEQLGAVFETARTPILKYARHGLFHDAAVRKEVELNRNQATAIVASSTGVVLNPSKMLEDIQTSLDSYIVKLRDPASENDELRRTFSDCCRELAAEFDSYEPVLPNTVTTPSPMNSRFQPGPYDQQGGLPPAPR